MRKKDAQCLLQAKIENIYLFKKNFENIFKKLAVPKFLLLPKKSELPKILGGADETKVSSLETRVSSLKTTALSLETQFSSLERVVTYF